MKKILTKKLESILVDNDTYDLVSDTNWYISKSGYVVTSKMISKGKYKTIYLHRLVKNAETGSVVDHKNRNKLDNRRSNLRVCNMSENSQNHSVYSNNKSGYTGVSFNKSRKKWSSYIGSSGVNRLFLGYYSTPTEAAIAYNNKAKEIYREFANYNLITQE